MRIKKCDCVLESQGITDNSFKVDFLIYGETNKTTYMLQTYEGKSDVESLSSIIRLWDKNNEYKMLPTSSVNPRIAPIRTRRTVKGIIGVIHPLLSVGCRKKQRMRNQMSIIIL